MKASKNFDKFLLLLWKNWLLRLRRPVSTVCEIVIPITFCLLLSLIATIIPIEHKEEVSFEALSLNEVSFEALSLNKSIIVNIPSFRITRIFWSPCGNPSLVKIMTRISIKMQREHECKDDSESLQKALQHGRGKGDVGVQFEDSLAGQIGLHKNIKVSLRFLESDNWKTNILAPIEQVAGPRSELGFSFGSFYFDNGFLTLQNDIFLELINDSMQDKFPQIQIRRFPYSAYTSYPVYLLHNICEILFWFGTMPLFINTICMIAGEKEAQVKEIMKIMGLANWLQWTAWFATTLIISLIPIILVAIMLKVPVFTEIAVLPRTDFLVLLCFLILFLCATISFAFAVSVFFSMSSIAAIIGSVIFIVSCIPFYIMSSTAPFLEKISACLLCNTALGHGLKIIFTYEALVESLGFANLFTPATPVDSISLGAVMIMLTVDTILYLLITLYVEAVYPGLYGIPKAWYFPCTKSFWCRKSPNVGVDVTDKNLIQETNIYEKEPANIPAGMRLYRLKKKFGKNKTAVRNVSFNMFDGEITVLLGHNGAGKTTLMSMLTGMLPSTSGTAIIDGYDIRTDMSKIRESLGFCAQQNILFNNLTVSEHLYFFSKLKGMKKREAKHEASKYIELLNLTKKKNTKSKNLSGGMKRKLCVAIALCGQSKICIFDEPTSGMDPTARRQLWDIIQAEKKDRTTLLSTHFMDEADVLGDRIAIIANGVLQCYGSSFFLKKKYVSGYRLIIVKSKGCDVTKITKLLSYYIPEIKVDTDDVSEVTYVLPEQKSSIFESMLYELERNMKSLMIDSYGIALATMEEVFMKVGLEDDQNDDEKDLKETQPYLAKSASNVQERNHYLRGFALYGNQLLAMAIKKGITCYRAWVLLLIHFIVPICLLLIDFLRQRKTVETSTSPKLDFALESYNNPITVITTDNAKNMYYDEYKKILKQENREYFDWGNENMTSRLIKRTAEDTMLVRNHYIMGASFNQSKNTITAWFNNEYYHTAPLALQYVMNSLIKKNIGSDHSIQFSNDPAPQLVNATDKSEDYYFKDSYEYALILGTCMCFVTAYFAIFCVRERICKSKHLQLVSGTAVSAFLLISFAWDYIVYLLISICMVIVITCFVPASQISAILVILVLFGFVMLPTVYVFSYFFSKPSNAYIGIFLTCYILGVVVFNILQILLMFGSKYGHILHNVFLIIPIYTLISGAHNISEVYDFIKQCEMSKNPDNDWNMTSIEEIFTLPSINITWQKNTHTCDSSDYTYYSLNYGIGTHIRYLSVVGAISCIILFLIEYRICDCLLYQCVYKTPPKRKKGEGEEEEDEDVLEENRKIRKGEIKQTEYKLFLKNTSKYYHRLLAVNQLCLGVKEYECFGLLGVNGAGKTTTFKILTGEIKLSYGDAWICGLNIRRNMNKIRKRVGYCPQFDALLEDITGRETLLVYCLLRGIRIKDCKRISEQLAREFQFYKHLDKTVKHFSGGNKRKLSTAIALIGEPPVLLLDEPSTGMDPGTKRYLWNSLCKIRDRGKCIILVTHNMQECDAICTNVAIMVNGVFKCLGSPQHLKNKFADGYILTIKINKSTKEERDYLKEIDEFVRSNFSKAELKDTHETLVTYIIKDVKIPWSKIFGILENAKKRVAVIEDYSVSQFDLEQIFLHFTKLQKFVSE